MQCRDGLTRFLCFEKTTLKKSSNSESTGKKKKGLKSAEGVRRDVYFVKSQRASAQKTYRETSTDLMGIEIREILIVTVVEKIFQTRL